VEDAYKREKIWWEWIVVNNHHKCGNLPRNFAEVVVFAKFFDGFQETSICSLYKLLRKDFKQGIEKM
jgi:hypothetical protein